MGCYEWPWCHCYILGGARSQQGSSGRSKYTSAYDNVGDNNDADCIYGFIMANI